MTRQPPKRRGATPATDPRDQLEALLRLHAERALRNRGRLNKPMSETSVSASAIFSARPTVRIAGQADARVDTLLTAMRMEESEGGLSTLELRLVDWVPTSDGPAGDRVQRAVGAEAGRRIADRRG